MDYWGKGPDTNSVNSNIFDKISETMWISWIFKHKPSTLGIFCCNDRKNKILILVLEEEGQDWAATFKTYNLLCIFIIFLLINLWLTQGKSSQISLFFLVQILDSPINILFDILKYCMLISKVCLNIGCVAWIVAQHIYMQLDPFFWLTHFVINSFCDCITLFFFHFQTSLTFWIWKIT